MMLNRTTYLSLSPKLTQLCCVRCLKSLIQHMLGYHWTRRYKCINKPQDSEKKIADPQLFMNI